MIEASGINYKIGSKNILKNINLKVNDGEAVGLIGASGSGKTILLKILAGQIKNTDGSIFIDGTDSKLLKKNQIIKLISNFSRIIPENQDDSVYNFILSARLPWIKPLNPYSEIDRSIAEETVVNLNLISYKNSKLSEISDSILLKAMIARTFTKLSGFMIMDEPSAGLDIASLLELSKSISKYLIDGKRCILISSQDINFICRIADRIYIMENGEIALEISPYNLDSKIISRYFHAESIISKNIYNGKTEVHLFPE
jgi:ABC-type cobalamin/Fe3+-siderophores transport system ATPase subunit